MAACHNAQGHGSVGPDQGQGEGDIQRSVQTGRAGAHRGYGGAAGAGLYTCASICASVHPGQGRREESVRVACTVGRPPRGSVVPRWCLRMHPVPCCLVPTLIVGASYIQGQGLFAASRCLWDEKSDNYVRGQTRPSVFTRRAHHTCYTPLAFAATHEWCRATLIHQNSTRVCTAGVRLILQQLALCGCHGVRLLLRISDSQASKKDPNARPHRST